jgi:hypothetical protein
VPVQSVFKDGEVRYCWVPSVAMGYERREITVGAQNEDFVEIINGLHEGERVSLVDRGES